MTDIPTKLALGVLVSGNGTNLQALIDASEKGLLKARINVVISDKPDAYALERAIKHGIPHHVIERKSFSSRDTFETAIIDTLKKHNTELVCLAGFMRIVGQTLLGAYPMRIINIHPSLLPAFPGLEAQRQALDHGAKYTGCTVHFVDEKTDHGPIICQATVQVHKDDTVETLKQRILNEEHRIYTQAINLICEGMVEIKGRSVIVK